MASARAGAPGGATEDLPIWRPSAQSYQNLAAFTAAISVASAVVLAITDSVGLVVATEIVAVVAAALLTASVSRQRVRVALSLAESQDFGNWPGSEDDRRELRRRGWRRCGRSVAMAIVLGAFAGFYPSVAVACVGAGTAGCFGSLAVVKWLHAYEAANDVTVMSPARAGRGRSHTLVYGTAKGRF